MIGTLSARDDNTITISLSTEDALDTVAMEMVRSNTIQGILPEEFLLENGEMTIHCDRTGLHALSELEEGLTAEQMLALISSTADHLARLEDYLIPEATLLWDKECFFVKDDFSVMQICVPADGGAENTFVTFLADLFNDDLTKNVADFVKEEIMNAVSADDYKVQFLPLKIDNLKMKVAAGRAEELSKDAGKVVLKKATPAAGTDSREDHVVLHRDHKEPQIEKSIHISLKSKNIAYLIRTDGGEKIPLKGSGRTFILGSRADAVDYCVKGNPSVSRTHAEITKDEGGYAITDLNSLNHTYVNGQMVKRGEYTALVHGDKIVLADEEFTFYQA